jgi:hypothetical protein
MSANRASAAAARVAQVDGSARSAAPSRAVCRTARAAWTAGGGAPSSDLGREASSHGR